MGQGRHTLRSISDHVHRQKNLQLQLSPGLVTS